MAELFHIPMFLGFKTETDSYELQSYMKEMVAADMPRFREMNDEFDDKFPGVRNQVSAATRDINGVYGTYVCPKDFSLRFVDGTVSLVPISEAA